MTLQFGGTGGGGDLRVPEETHLGGFDPLQELLCFPSITAKDTFRIY